ncbi:MAG: amidohydrolase [Thermodesulfobacteriota bacterium]
MTEREIPQGTLRIGRGKILEIREGEAEEQIDASVCPVIDLQGRTVTPGFIDSHAHMLYTGLFQDAILLSGAVSIDEVLQLVEEGCLKQLQGHWVFGSGLSHQNLKEKRTPSREELDRVSQRNPVWLVSETCHSSTANTLGLQRIGLPADLPGVETEVSTGKPTGRFLTDQAHFGASRRILGSLEEQEVRRMVERVCSDAAEKGVTSIHAMDGSPDSDRVFLKLFETIPHMPIRITPYFQTLDVDRVLELGLPRIGGCLTLDGAWPEHTVALREPYRDRSESRGMLFYTDEQVEQFIKRAHREGLQATMHAIGDAAIEQIIRAYEKAFDKEKNLRHRHRIEHFSLPLGDLVDRAADLGIVVAMQPMFSYLWGGPGGDYVRYLGEERASQIEDFRSILDHGLIVCGGSDSPVTPLNPLMGIHAAVNNPFPRHRVSVDEALRMFTVYGAWASFEEESRGTIEEGKAADLVVLSEDPGSVDPGGLAEIKVELTVAGGRIVYDSRGECASA